MLSFLKVKEYCKKCVNRKQTVSCADKYLACEKSSKVIRH